MSPEVYGRVLRFIESSACAGFDELALEVFRFQYEHNPAYRGWCDAHGCRAETVRTAEDIPAVSTAAFKELEFACGTAEAEFTTSGTTDGTPGRHLMPSLALYRASALGHFRRRMGFPAGERRRIIVVAPPPGVRPRSSLSKMLAWIVEECGDGGSGWYVSANGLEREKLAASLGSIEREREPVFLAGTTAAFLAFFDYCESIGAAFRLPAGSGFMDTGGPKGCGLTQVPPLAEFQADVYRRAGSTLGIPPEKCVNEYGMTEMASQFYDAAPGTGPRLKAGPPWVRTRVLSSETLRPLPAGEIGLLRHLDLANAGSVMGVLTEDLGREAEGGFILEGRPAAASARGCGLTFEELAGLGSRRR